MNPYLELPSPAQSEAGNLASIYGLENHGLANLHRVYWNLPTPALYEEIVFRGVVFSSLRDHWGEGRALLVSSALFGIIHLSPLNMIPTGFIGLLLARAFSSTRSLWSAVIAHCVYNSIALALGLLATGLIR